MKMANQMVPYVFFYGRTAEALAFYQKVFGGSSEIMRAGDSPMASEMPPGSEHRVMHASFTSDIVSLMASDGRDTRDVDPDAGNISLALSFDDAAKGEQVFNALGEGGNVGMPIDAAFWGGRFGMVTDKFGTEWMVTLP
jgi:PhnB protein